jgi:hypothetical protein
MRTDNEFPMIGVFIVAMDVCVNDDLMSNNKLDECFAKNLVTRDDIRSVEFNLLLGLKLKSAAALTDCVDVGSGTY